MKVKVTLSEPVGFNGLENLAAQWMRNYPEGKLESISAYGKLELTLILPDATQVIQPQLVDLTATTVE
jgi:hypothetical protein